MFYSEVIYKISSFAYIFSLNFYTFFVFLLLYNDLKLKRRILNLFKRFFNVLSQCFTVKLYTKSLRSFLQCFRYFSVGYYSKVLLSQHPFYQPNSKAANVNWGPSIFYGPNLEKQGNVI